MTDEERKQRHRDQMRDCNREKILRETPEERQRRLAHQREYEREKRLHETEEERERRLEYYREYSRKRLRSETPEERERRLEYSREYSRKKREAEAQTRMKPCFCGCGQLTRTKWHSTACKERFRRMKDPEAARRRKKAFFERH